MRRTRTPGWRRLWPVSAALALFALALLGSAGSLAEPDDPTSYMLYLPFAAKPLPTPTPTPTPTATPVPPDIRVDAACCNVRGGTAQDPSGEYVCFRSYDWRATDMTGWLVKDRVRLRYTFPAFVLGPGATVLLHSGQGHNSATDLYAGGGLIWNNDHDTVYLRDASDQEVDTYIY